MTDEDARPAWLDPDVESAILEVQGWLAVGEGRALYKLARHATPAVIVEIGSWRGRSTAYLAAARRDVGDGVVVAVDTWQGSPESEAHRAILREYDPDQLFEEFRSNIAALDLSSFVHPVRGSSTVVAGVWPSLRATDAGVGVLFVDGSHEYEAVRADVASWWPHLAPGAFVALHDVPDWPGPAQVVDELTAAVKPEWAAAIDLEPWAHIGSLWIARRRDGQTNPP